VNKRLGLLVASGVVLAACGSVSPSSAMSKWLSQSQFRANLSTLQADVRASAKQLRLASATPNDLHTVCAVLDIDVESLNASLPTPDKQSTALLAKAYNDLGAGANQCYAADSRSSVRTSALDWLNKGMAALSEGSARLRVASGAAP
jgi:hypothetical protein